MSRILLIEDNANNRYLFSYLLRGAGHEVVEAESGEQGLAAARARRPDLILLDIQLPGKDGFAVLEELRSMALVGEVPVAAVTSHAMPGDRERILKAGCTDYLEKPIDPDCFVDQVERLLKPGGVQ